MFDHKKYSFKLNDSSFELERKRNEFILFTKNNIQYQMYYTGILQDLQDFINEFNIYADQEIKLRLKQQNKNIQTSNLI